MLIVCWKAFTISWEISASNRFANFLFLIQQDIWFFDLQMIFLLLRLFNIRLVNAATGYCIWFLSIIYIVSTVVLLQLDFVVTGKTIIRFLHEPDIISSFISANTIFAAIVFIIATFISIRIPRNIFLLFILCCFGIEVIPLDCRDSLQLHHYAFSLKAFFSSNTSQPNELSFNATEIQALLKDFSPFSPPNIPVNPPNIIMVVMESLSAVDVPSIFPPSSGMMSEIDTLSRKGLLFTNVTANGTTSEFGAAAIFGGEPPIPFPGSTGNAHLDFARMPSVLKEYNARGYSSTLITTGDLSFLSQGEFARSVGFSDVIGRDDTARFRTSPRFALNSPPDHALYDEAIDHLDERTKEPGHPFFLSLLTTSSHPPWKDPLARGNTESNVWNYVSGELERFVDTLETRHFFDRGILIITGDHRKYKIVSNDELAEFGLEARYRIPLLIIGDGFPAGVRSSIPLQQSDLLPKLFELPLLTKSPSQALLSYDVEAAQFAAQFQSLFAPLMLFDVTTNQPRAFRGTIEGKNIEWLDRDRQAPASFEHWIQQLRAYYQFHSIHPNSLCPSGVPNPSANKNVMDYFMAELFPGNDLSDRILLDPSHRQDVFNLTTLDGIRERFWAKKNLSVRLSRSIISNHEDTYQFKMLSDDGACLYIDGKLVIDGGFVRRTAPSLGEDTLSSGVHAIEIRYFQVAGAASLELEWRPQSSKLWTTFPVTP